MHRQLTDLLPTAKGQAKHVIVAFLDIRGFTSFPGFADSIQAAMYLKKIYLSILERYFTASSFFKLTGDGMMIIYCHEEEELSEKAQEIVSTSLRLIEDFPTLLQDDPMITFEVPTHLGIGLARGAATSLATESHTLDFSGRPLNIAARLMDLARPMGVVMESTFDNRVVGDEIFNKFEKHKAYIKGIAELTPLDILLVPNWTKVKDEAKRPIGKYKWHTQTHSVTLRRLEEQGSNFQLRLEKVPAFIEQIQVTSECSEPRPSGHGTTGLRLITPMKFIHFDDAGSDSIRLDCKAEANRLKLNGLKPTWQITIKVKYRYVPDD